MIKQFAAGLAVTALTLQPALAAPAKCISSADLRAGAHFIMPILIDGIATKCAPALGSGSYLVSKGPDLAKRYEALPGDDSVVTSLIARLDNKGEMAGMTPAEARVFLKIGLFKAMGKDLTADICTKVDKVLSLVDPMPAENTVGLVEFFLREEDANKARRAARLGKPFEAKMCPAS
ncbi:MAG: hypothetical protein JSS36_01680 [Proteobacteria bacterium]|nr:hypothetical protein [Pseudomonadota bacterium]